MKQLAIIDDDPEILKLLDQYLTKNGFEVEAFTDGESFLKEDVNKYQFNCFRYWPSRHRRSRSL